MKEYKYSFLGTCLFAICVALFMILYWPITNVKPYADEWGWLAQARLVSEQGVWRGIAEIFTTPTGLFYRPLSILPLTLVSGDNLTFTLRLKLFAVMGASLLVVWMVGRLSSNRMLPWLVGLLFLIHQCMVLGGEVDWWGDTLRLIAILSIFAIHLVPLSPPRSIQWRVAATVALSLIAVGAKESGVIAPLLPLLAGYSSQGKLAWRSNTPSALASLSVVIVYLVIRGVVIANGADAADSYYEFTVGLNVAKNLALLVVGVLSPINTVSVALGGWIPKGLALLWTLLLSLVCLYSANKFRRDHPTLLLGLAVTAIVVQGPVLLMPH